MIQMICKNCGRPFPFKANKRYCCDKCRYDYGNKKKKEIDKNVRRK